MKVILTRSITILLLVVIMSLTSHTSKASNDIPSVKPGQHQASMSRDVKAKMDYLLYLPDNYNAEQKSWPLIVFLHGSGERGDNLEKVKSHGPPNIVAHGRKLPFIIVSPQCPEDKWWPYLSTEVMALVDEVVEKYNVDQSRIYLTGMSMGGYGTWNIASIYPGRFAAIAPICGGGDRWIADNLRNTPTWAFHGAKDKTVPLEESQKMIDRIKGNRKDVKFTIYPDAEHDSWSRTYDNEELYKWFLSHTKKQK